ncbi:MAG: ester cyclase [Actinomycetota bacterium]
MSETKPTTAARTTKGRAAAAKPAPEEVARQIFEALAVMDLERVAPFVHPDAVDDFVAVGVYRGRERILGFFRELFGAFPDFSLRVGHIVADAGTAVIQWEATGSFTGGPFLGIQPTGKRITIRGVDVMEIADGQVRHNTIYYDGATFGREVGLMPRAGSPADRAMLASFNAATKLRARIRERRGR